MSCRVKPRSLIQSTFVILYIGPIKRTPLYFIVENPISGWRISTGFFPFSRYPPNIRRMVDIRLLSYGYVLSVYRVLSSEQLILISGLSPLIGFPKRHKCWTRTWSSIIKNENPITGLSGRSDSARPGFREADIRRNPFFWLSHSKVTVVVEATQIKKRWLADEFLEV